MADDTVTKEEAEYQDAPKGREFCGRCTMFRPPHKCSYVRGYIERDGWCRFFEAKGGK